MFRKYLNQIKKSKAKTHISLAILIATIATLTTLGTQNAQAYRVAARKEACTGSSHTWNSAIPGHFAVIWLSHIFEKTVDYLFREGKITSGCAEDKQPPAFPYPNAIKTISNNYQAANSL
ncbi:hypothetical protein KTO58_20695 [Chitinophaga pendula]|uniref:hypothetical protein n=1 Tax=Chitinophaga TaxID=79328 RepID=UPI000BB02FA3|nr:MULTISPECIES: hypothetical protein [Chitinophaga]ASZ10942.1 hypothetical protein CK934_08110 [Chitinophaga sp. MD30]UCJ06070.1 hypothetical protein KTO58_20695 [Chitinophaga pendula]